MSTRIITTIPVYNGEKFILQTLQSLARQSLLPDRVLVLDNCSTDRTEEIVRCFRDFPCEFVRNPTNLGLFQNFNRCLEFATETEYLHILHADDTIKRDFYETMTQTLTGCCGRGMAWCLDERIDENGVHLSFSGKEDNSIENLEQDQFLRRKAEIGNQAFCATLLRTGHLPAPCLFSLDYPILGDMVFWAEYGLHCEKIAHVHRALGNYRWHGSNETVFRSPTIQSLIYDEWRAMQSIERLRGMGWSLHRKLKLKGLFSVRSGIKAKRVRQNGDAVYSREIVKAARGITGEPLWLAGQILVEIRDFYLFIILGRKRHPKNIFG